MFYSGLILGLALGFLLGAGIAVIIPLLIMSGRESRLEEETERWSRLQNEWHPGPNSTANHRRNQK